MCSILNSVHKRAITTRRLKYLRQKLGLKKRSFISNQTVHDIVSNELFTSNRKVGYRQMAEFINLKYGTVIPKEKVRVVLKSIDPEGVKERSRNVIKRRIYQTQGPNDVHHIDGNDKLKKWGFCIHGAIDEFNRKLLCLKVATTNNDPLVIGNFYIEMVKEHKIVPKLVRMDRGCGNIYIGDLQVFFTGRDDSFQYATSTRNQRIEAFWSRLKKFRLSWWITFFEDMERNGLFKSHLETGNFDLRFLTNSATRVQGICTHLEHTPCSTIIISSWRKTRFTLCNSHSNWIP